MRRRFRANVEFLDTDPFWEDRLYGAGFLVGDVRVHAVNPCQRCVVPARDPVTGETLVGFQNRFNQLRRDNLPDDAPADCFNHHYRLAVNTHIDASEAGKFIHIDMDVRFPA